MSNDGYIDRLVIYDRLLKETLIKSKYILYLSFTHNYSSGYAELYFYSNIKIANTYRDRVSNPTMVIYYKMYDYQMYYERLFSILLRAFNKLNENKCYRSINGIAKILLE